MVPQTNSQLKVPSLRVGKNMISTLRREIIFSNFRLIATWVRAAPISVFSLFYNANIVYNILKEFKSYGLTNKFKIKGSLTKGW